MANRNTRTSNPVNTTAAAAAPAAATQTAAPTHVSPYVGHVTQQVVALANPYNVRAGTAQNNVASWQLVQAFLAANGGTCTVGALQAHLTAARNHGSFATYCVRRGYLGTPLAPPCVVATPACIGL